MSNSIGASLPTATADLSGVGYCIAFNFRRTARVLTNVYDAALQASGLRSTQFSILVAVANSQPVCIGDLAEVLLIDQSTLSRSLRLLQKRRFVTISGRSTLRQRFVSLSPLGARALDDSVLRWRQMQKHFLALIGHQNWKQLRGELATLSRRAVDLQESIVFGNSTQKA
jgi:DNA-binding MarR family transcriptional regulator